MPVGDLAAYFRIAEELELREIINGCCPKAGAEPGIPILALAFNQLAHRYSTARVGDWFDSTPMPGWFETDLKLSQDILLGALDSLCRRENGGVAHYGWKVQREIVEAWKRTYGEDSRRLYYDVTRLRYHGDRCGLAERGRNSDSGEREVGVSLVTSQDSCFPVLCRPIPGARSDSLTVKDIVNSLWSWGIKRTTLIMDRGMVGTPNLGFAVEKGYDLLIGCPETSVDTLEAMGCWSDEEMMKPENVFKRKEKTYLYMKGHNGELLGVSGKFVTVLDPLTLAEERSERDWMMKELGSPQTGAERRGELLKELGVSGFGSPETSDMGRLHTLELLKRRDGRFLLFSTRKRISEADAFKWYFQKDEIEKAFRSLNNEAKMIPLRHRIEERIEAYLTVNFIAYLLLAVLQYKLRKKGCTRGLSDVMYEAGRITQIDFLSKGRKRSTLVQPTHSQQGLMRLLGISGMLPKT